MNEKYKWPLINDNIPQSDKDVLIDFLLNPGKKLTQGENVEKFEKSWSDWLGVKYSLFVNSGSNANFLMAAVLKELYGTGEVIVPPIGWVSDVACLLTFGFTPVFTDVDPHTMSISVNTIKKCVSKKTIGILLVHALGFNALSDEMLDFVNDCNIVLMEDCCEAHGTLHHNNRVGAYGLMSNFSFYFGHHITTIEGGMVCTNNDNVYNLLKMYRSHGLTREISPKIQSLYKRKYPGLNPLFTFAVPGLNCRSTELNAVLGLEQMKRIDNNIEKRRKNLVTWLSNLNSSLYWTNFNIIGNSNFALPLILKEKNDKTFQQICDILETESVEFRIGTAGGGNQCLQPYLLEGKYNYRIQDELYNAEHIHYYGLYIGNHTELTDDLIIDICRKLNRIGTI